MEKSLVSAMGILGMDEAQCFMEHVQEGVYQDHRGNNGFRNHSCQPGQQVGNSESLLCSALV